VDLVTTVNEHKTLGQSIRLHVGCGSRIFENYINVDGQYMAHDPAVAIHDLTTPFPLPENSVDEILSVHVIEHIPRSRVPVMLADWLRILKPGGFVAIEWPDFLKMCTEIVKNPASIYSEDRRVLKRTILGIFGDNERYPDPVMWHKWGYSADSLQHILRSQGFRITHAEPCHHSKTPNDSRVVAFK
jgi:hypothetical protein